MDEILRSLTLRPEPWTAPQIALNVGISFLLGIFVSWVYRATHRQLTVSFSFLNTLVLVTMIMCLVIMVIGDNIARAFGLAGAMSIIRFRTVVKDTRDTAFIFYALGAGMAAGTGNLRIAVLGTLLVGLSAGILHWTRHGAVALETFLLYFEMEPQDAAPQAEAYLPVFKRSLHTWQLISTKAVRMGELVAQTYQVQLRSGHEASDFVRELSAIEGLFRVQLAHGEEAEI